MWTRFWTRGTLSCKVWSKGLVSREEGRKGRIERGQTGNALHGTMGRPATGGAREEVRGVGLRRPRAGVLGGPLRRGQGPIRRRLRGRTVGDTALQRPELLVHKQPPRWPGGLRPHRRSPQGHAPPGRLGRRRPRGGAPARRTEDEGHGEGRGPLRGDAGQRVYRVEHLAPALLVPAERLRRGRARLRGL